VEERLINARSRDAGTDKRARNRWTEEEGPKGVPNSEGAPRPRDPGRNQKNLTERGGEKSGKKRTC